MAFKKLISLIALASLTLSASPGFSSESTDDESTKWAHESELGVVITGGNSDTQSVNVKHKSQVDWTKNVAKIFGSYLKSSANGANLSEIWEAGVRYERVVSKKMNVFAANTWDGNIDSGYEYRSNVDLGGKYTYYKEKKNYLFSELGYRFSYEQKVDGIDPPLVRSHIIRIYNEYAKEINDKSYFKYWLELLPDLAESENLQFNTEASLSMTLTTILSLKIAYLAKYDNVPAAADGDRFDTIFTTTLVANF